MNKGIYNFYYYFNYLLELIKKDFKKKYYKSTLGVVWTILNPLMMMIVVSIVFSTLFKRSIPNFPVYYFSGTLLMSFFTGSTNQALGSISGNYTIITKMRVPKYMFPLAMVGNNFITLLFSLIPLIGIMIYTKVQFTPYIFIFPIVLIQIFLFTVGVSLILAAYSVIFRDLKHLYGILITILQYITPLFYPIDIIPQRFVFLWELNPLYIYISIARSSLLYGVMPTEKMILSATFYSILILITGFVCFRSQENKFLIHA